VPRISLEEPLEATIMKLRDSLSLTETVEGGFLLDKHTGDCYALNTLGVYLWHCLAASRTRDDILDTLAHRFGNTPRATIEEDVSRFINALIERQLVVA
jgi:hypothetical protein